MATKRQAKKKLQAREDARATKRFFTITALCVGILLAIMFAVYSTT